MMALFVRFLLTGVLTAVIAVADEPAMPSWITNVNRLPDSLEEKLYLIPGEISVKKEGELLAVEFEINFVCGLKSDVFLRKPQTQHAFAELSVHKGGKPLALNGKQTDLVPSRREEYVLIESAWMEGKPMPRDASVYAARFSLTLTKNDPVVKHLTNDAIKGGDVRIRLIFLCKLFLVGEGRWLNADTVSLVITGAK